jgi:hypothetical protein
LTGESRGCYKEITSIGFGKEIAMLAQPLPYEVDPKIALEQWFSLHVPVVSKVFATAAPVLFIIGVTILVICLINRKKRP